VQKKKLVLFVKFLHFVNNNNRGTPKVVAEGGLLGCKPPPPPQNQNLRNADFVEMIILKISLD
jgi:hypothetical protein